MLIFLPNPANTTSSKALPLKVCVVETHALKLFRFRQMHQDSFIAMPTVEVLAEIPSISSKPVTKKTTQNNTYTKVAEQSR